MGQPPLRMVETEVPQTRRSPQRLRKNKSLSQISCSGPPKCSGGGGSNHAKYVLSVLSRCVTLLWSHYRGPILMGLWSFVLRLRKKWDTLRKLKSFYFHYCCLSQPFIHGKFQSWPNFSKYESTRRMRNAPLITERKMSPCSIWCKNIHITMKGTSKI